MDRYAGAKYNGYETLEDFYTDMAMLGDVNWDDYRQRPSEDGGLLYYSEEGPKPPLLKDEKIGNLSIPLLALQSLDDPISTWRCNGANNGLFHPNRIVHEIKENDGNLVIMLTKTGGHVGWPLGWFPSNNNWKFMSNVASGFINAVIQARKEQQQQDEAESRHDVAEEEAVTAGEEDITTERRLPTTLTNNVTTQQCPNSSLVPSRSATSKNNKTKEEEEDDEEAYHSTKSNDRHQKTTSFSSEYTCSAVPTFLSFVDDN